MFHHLWHKNSQIVLAMKLLLSVMAARAIITLKKVMASCIKLLHASLLWTGKFGIDVLHAKTHIVHKVKVILTCF